jgi:hypothetical protein
MIATSTLVPPSNTLTADTIGINPANIPGPSNTDLGLNVSLNPTNNISAVDEIITQAQIVETLIKELNAWTDGPQPTLNEIFEHEKKIGNFPQDWDFNQWKDWTFNTGKLAAIKQGVPTRVLRDNAWRSNPTGKSGWTSNNDVPYDKWDIAPAIRNEIDKKIESYKEEGYFSNNPNPTYKDLFELESKFAGESNEYFPTAKHRTYNKWLHFLSRAKLNNKNQFIGWNKWGGFQEVGPDTLEVEEESSTINTDQLNDAQLEERHINEFISSSKSVITDPEDFKDWYDLRASTWYEGYGSDIPAGENNFVDLSQLDTNSAEYQTALGAITNNILGLFEQKGISKDQAEESNRFQALIQLAKDGDTLGAFRGAAAHIPNAAARGALWGTPEDDGGLPELGKSYLESIRDSEQSPESDFDEGSHNYWIDVINNFYVKGFGVPQNHDTAGLIYWLNSVKSLPDDYTVVDKSKWLAERFLESSGAQLRDKYYEHYGRDADQTGLAYWLDEANPAESFDRSVSYTGEDINKDGYISVDEVFNSLYDVQTETAIRNWLKNNLGQLSKPEDSQPDYIYTGANNSDVVATVNEINSLSEDDQLDAMTALNDSIATESVIRDTASQAGSDTNPNDPSATGIGTTLTDQQVDDTKDTYYSDDSQDILDSAQTQFDETGEWGAMIPGTGDPNAEYVPFTGYQTGTMTAEEAEQLILNKNLEEWYKNSSLWEPSIPGKEEKDPLGEEGWTPEPLTKPEKPESIPYDTEEIDYKTNYKSDVKDTSGYSEAKSEFDKAYQSLNPIVNADGSASPQNVGQRFVDKSAKGVRFKRSKAAESGRAALGTKQLARKHIPTPLSTTYKSQQRQQPQQQVRKPSLEQFNWDIDGDGKFTALGDGLLIMRKAFGNSFKGDALTEGVLHKGSTRSTDEIHEYLEKYMPLKNK